MGNSILPECRKLHFHISFFHQNQKKSMITIFPSCVHIFTIHILIYFIQLRSYKILQKKLRRLYGSFYGKSLTTLGTHFYVHTTLRKRGAFLLTAMLQTWYFLLKNLCKSLSVPNPSTHS